MANEKTKEIAIKGRKLGSLPALYFEDEVAAYLGMSVTTLKRESARGKIKGTTVASGTQYTEDQIRDYLKLNSEKPQ